MKNKVYTIFVAILTLCFWQNTYAQQIVGTSPIKWYTITEAEKLDSIEHKPFLIDIYTDWCGWCKRMMATTFSVQGIANYINNNFYPVRLDAETKDTLLFEGKKWTSDGRVNELAKHLLGGRLSYPTIVYLTREKHEALPVPGYMDVNDIEPFLVYFSENIHTTTSIETFNNSYMMTYPKIYEKQLIKLPEEQKPDTSGTINWITFEEATEKCAKEPKPILVDFYATWSIPSTIQDKTIFRDKNLANKINEQFYAIRFNAIEQDTVRAFGQTFAATGKNTPHQLTIAMMQGKYVFPSVYFLNKEGQIVSHTENFFPTDFWTYIIDYYGQELYKKETFEQYYNRKADNGK